MARYGMTIPLPGIPLHAHEDWLKEMLDVGYTDFWTSEANGHDGFTPLAMAAAWTPTARLGIAIIPAFTRGPALMAQCVASLAEAAPGRFVMGIGSSSDVIVERWNGIPFEQPYQQTRDMVKFLRRALAGEKVDEEFERFTVKGFRYGVKLDQPPPILIAALRQGMLKLAGRLGDGAILNWLSTEDVGQVAPYVHEGGEGQRDRRAYLRHSDRRPGCGPGDRSSCGGRLFERSGLRRIPSMARSRRSPGRHVEGLEGR